jgi:hypothetical protein
MIILIRWKLFTIDRLGPVRVDKIPVFRTILSSALVHSFLFEEDHRKKVLTYHLRIVWAFPLIGI